jgi:hypothetical protein
MKMFRQIFGRVFEIGISLVVLICLLVFVTPILFIWWALDWREPTEQDLKDEYYGRLL